ncbi:CsgE family curli-type amyloid fiber assembly protein [Alkalitalea saponilacus]|uniref:Curli production assembly/transport component CsgE n=1 Tax=Alkalitalea saponilacus TaxID=889453 RepID=A0A1T5CBX2_9BACT|nr:CsgE family curli-type amyloid fiber assembly protein [Alkalitalea saponilacus]ASB49804.1 hypothetical protein CDL62_12005 [Alkalitalea saponilacus]SKB56965.1 Curli assembly protein CsgE [Alkalitalea saponilacus]
MTKALYCTFFFLTTMCFKANGHNPEAQESNDTIQNNATLKLLKQLFSSEAGNNNGINTENNVEAVEFMNFVFDETITKIGGDFFRMFDSEWENPSNVRGVNMFIGEQPMPGMGTQIWIRVEDRYIFRSFVRPNQEQLRQSVEKALQQAESYFLNYELIQKELESDDFSGTGLF